jgi:hypothetical protein
LAWLISKPPAITSIVTYRHRPKRSPPKKPAQPVPIGSQIVTTKRPNMWHEGEITDPTDPDYYDAVTERAKLAIQRALKDGRSSKP